MGLETAIVGSLFGYDKYKDQKKDKKKAQAEAAAANERAKLAEADRDRVRANFTGLAGTTAAEDNPLLSGTASDISKKRATMF